MDNHADNFIVNENYIAGLVDSDFGIFISRYLPRGKVQYKPIISFVNTNFDLIELVHSYLAKNGVNHHIAYRTATVGRDKKEITISKFDKCIKFIDKIIGYSVVRKPQLAIMKNFCEDRYKYVSELGWKQNNTPYTDFQTKLYEELVLLNMNYNYDNGSRNYTASWLGGMIDGDGSICFVVTKNKKPVYKSPTGETKEYYHDRIIPMIDITTGSDTNLNNLKELYDNLGIKYDIRISKSKATKRLGRNKKKFHYNIYVKSYDDVEKLLLYLDGKLYTKQQQLTLMLKYLQMKKENRFNTEEIFDIVNEVGRLNHINYRDISETLRKTQKCEDIVQPV